MKLHEVNIPTTNFINEEKLIKLWTKTNILHESEIKKSRTLLENVTSGMNTQQRRIVEGIYIELFPLIEATLSQDQIYKIFQQVEQGVTQTGNNRTLVGKGVDIASKANQMINNLGKYLQNTQPVQQADQKFAGLQQSLSQKYPELAQQVRNLGAWMKSNPGKSAFVIGTLTALASLGAGPAGGAIAGQVLRGAAELIKGEKLSTAVGKGVKTAALGYLSGKAFEMLGNYVSSFKEHVAQIGPKDAGLTNVSYGATREIQSGMVSSSETLKGFNIVVYPEERQAIEQAMQMIRDHQPGGFDKLRELATYIRSPEYKQAMKDALANVNVGQASNDSLSQWVNGIAQAGQAITQGAIAGSGQGPAMSNVASKMSASQQSKPTQSKPQDPYMVGQRMAASQQTPLSESQIYLIIGKVVNKQKIQEGIVDDLKNKAKQVVGKAANFVATKAKNITTNITADKLLQAWNKAGKPTDSDELAKVLVNAGAGQDIVNSAIQNVAGTTQQNNVAGATNQQTNTTSVPFTAGSSGYGQPPAGYGSTTTNYTTGNIDTPKTATPGNTTTKPTKVRDPKTGRYIRTAGGTQSGTPKQTSSNLQPDTRPMADAPFGALRQDAQRRESENRLVRAMLLNIDDITNKDLLQSIIAKAQSRLQQ